MLAKAPNTTEVSVLPTCDLAHLRSYGPCDGSAYADVKLSGEFGGVWANICKAHFDRVGCQLGIGRGQRLVVVKR